MNWIKEVGVLSTALAQKSQAQEIGKVEEAALHKTCHAFQYRDDNPCSPGNGVALKDLIQSVPLRHT